MQKYTLTLIVLLSFILAACASMDGTPTSDIEIDAKADDKVNFKGLKSYAWFGTAGILKDPDGKWEPPEFDADSELKFLIDRELRKRGMSETSNNPDVLVAFALAIDMDALKLGANDPDSNQFNIENVPKGALVVMMINPETLRPIWTGVATAEKQEKATSETQKKRLDYVVTGMLDKLPN